MGPSSVMDVIYPDNQVALSSPLMGALSDTQAPGRKRVSQEKQAYTNELENKVSRLEEENERLRKRKVYIFF
uniref:BZIP domain-containing protein n=1 Tax=Vitis vinifera TaxID=29760 RepID=F6H814_VITVI